DVRLEVVALALEVGVGPGADPEVEIPAGAVGSAAPLSGRADPRALADAGGNLHLHRARRGSLAHLDRSRRPLRDLFQGQLRDALHVLALGLAGGPAEDLLEPAAAARAVPALAARAEAASAAEDG